MYVLWLCTFCCHVCSISEHSWFFICVSQQERKRENHASVRNLLALLPPIIAIVLALITKEVYSSLFIGIVVGALFYSGFSFEGTLNTSSSMKSMTHPTV